MDGLNQELTTDCISIFSSFLKKINIVKGVDDDQDSKNPVGSTFSTQAWRLSCGVWRLHVLLVLLQLPLSVQNMHLKLEWLT